MLLLFICQRSIGLKVTGHPVCRTQNECFTDVVPRRRYFSVIIHRKWRLALITPPYLLAQICRVFVRQFRAVSPSLTRELQPIWDATRSVIGPCDVSRNGNLILKFALRHAIIIASCQLKSCLSPFSHLKTIHNCKSEKKPCSNFAVDALPVLRHLLVHHSRVRIVQQKHPLYILQIKWW